MSQLTDLINSRAEELHIFQEDGETEESWTSRVVYSIIGVMASACLWNKYDPTIDEVYSQQSRESALRPRENDADSMVSDVYWKRFVKKLCYAYYMQYESALKDYFPGDVENLIKQVYSGAPSQTAEPSEEQDVCDYSKFGNWDDYINEILDLYIQTGSYYKKNYYLAPALRRTINLSQDVQLIRGISPGELFHVSGLGNWRFVQKKTNAVINFEKLYDLQQESYAEYYQHLETRFDAEGEYGDLPDAAKFLRMQPRSIKRWGPYWLDSPDLRDQKLSLGRFGNRGQERYFLFRREGNRHKILSLSSYETNPEHRRPRNGSREYIRIASALLTNRGTLPEIRVTIGSSTVSLDFGYLLPPAELSFIKLYSWSEEGFKKVGQNYRRRVSKELYPPIEAYLERLGYTTRVGSKE